MKKYIFTFSYVVLSLSMTANAQSYSSINGLGSTQVHFTTNDLSTKYKDKNYSFLVHTTDDKPVLDKLTVDQAKCIKSQLDQIEIFKNSSNSAGLSELMTNLKVPTIQVRIEDNVSGKKKDADLNYSSYLGMGKFQYIKTNGTFTLNVYEDTPKEHMKIQSEQTKTLPGELVGKLRFRWTDEADNYEEISWYYNEYTPKAFKNIELNIHRDQMNISESNKSLFKNYIVLPAAKNSDYHAIVYTKRVEKVVTQPILSVKAVLDSNRNCKVVKAEDLANTYKNEWLVQMNLDEIGSLHAPIINNKAQK